MSKVPRFHRARSANLLSVLMVLSSLQMVLQSADSTDRSQRPNILWITVEDMSANLGCYGDSYAITPHLDAFSRESVRYTQAYATAPVCSPVRSCLITGVYATSLGTQRLRSSFPIPQSIRGFPYYLRQAVKGGSLVVHNSGVQTRDFVYLDDVVSALDRAGTASDVDGKTINIGSGREHSILDLVNSVIEVTGAKTEAIYNHKASGGVSRMRADITRAGVLLDWV